MTAAGNDEAEARMSDHLTEIHCICIKCHISDNVPKKKRHAQIKDTFFRRKMLLIQ